jgi:hypothetical protein
LRLGQKGETVKSETCAHLPPSFFTSNKWTTVGYDAMGKRTCL